MRLLTLPEVLIIAEAVEFIESLAAGIISEPQLAEWIRSRIH